MVQTRRARGDRLRRRVGPARRARARGRRRRRGRVCADERDGYRARVDAISGKPREGRLRWARRIAYKDMSVVVPYQS